MNYEEQGADIEEILKSPEVKSGIAVTTGSAVGGAAVGFVVGFGTMLGLGIGE